MNRIDQLFAGKKKDVLAVYFTAGFPSLEATETVFSELVKNNVDLIEIGMPFSDPLADGPVIQESSRVALENGMSIRMLFEQLENFRTPLASSRVPVVLMGYLNPVLQYGMPAFLSACERSGISGVILPDLPPEVYESEYRAMFEASGIHFIFLITPRTPEERIRRIAALSRGFIYLVSTAATTGNSGTFSAAQEMALKKVRDSIPGVPLLTGFGIHDYAGRQAMTAYTNGAVVGSALIRALASGDAIGKAVKKVITKLNTPAPEPETSI